MGGGASWSAGSAGTSAAGTFAASATLSAERISGALATILSKSVSMMHRPAPARNIQGSALRHNPRSGRLRNDPDAKHFRTHTANRFCRGGRVGEEEPAPVIARDGSETALRSLLLAGSAVMEATQTPRLPPTHVNRSTPG